MEEILEKVGMVVHGEIHEVLPTGTPVGESKTIQLEVRSFLSLVLYQGKWEDDRQKSNCRFCSARIPLPEGVAGKVDMLFTYNSNCLIDNSGGIEWGGENTREGEGTSGTTTKVRTLSA